MIAFCLAIVQFGLYYSSSNTAEAAAENAYQQSRAYKSTTQAGVTAGDATIAATPALLQNPHIEINRTADTVTVVVTGRALAILPALPLPPVTKTLTGPVERWIAP